MRKGEITLFHERTYRLVMIINVIENEFKIIMEESLFYSETFFH